MASFFMAAKCHNSANFYPIFKKIVEALPNVELYLKIVCALPNMHNLAARARPHLWTIWAIGIRVKQLKSCKNVKYVLGYLVGIVPRPLEAILGLSKNPYISIFHFLKSAKLD